MAAAPLDSALAKALLSGAAGVNVDRAAVEQAVNQQLIHGGTLDTLLLEGGVVDEPTVARALSFAWNTVPVPVGAFDDPDSRAVALLPARMAVAMGLLPFSLDDDGTLHVACRAPLDGGLVSEVGTLLRARVVAHVVPEIRLLQGLAAAYDHDLEERFVSLLRQLAPASKAARRESGEDAIDTSLKSLDEPLVTWDLAEAMAHLAAQDSRDGIARVAVAFARRFLPFAAVFGVRDNAAVGWHRSGPAEGVQFTARPFPVPSTGFLAAALSSPSPLLLKPDGGEGNAATLGWLGRRRPKTALVVPIVVARRPVGVLYADGGIRQKDPRDVGELVAFAARLGPAFEALLRQRHRAHPSLFPQPATTVPPTSLPPTSSSVLPALSLPPLPPITLPPVTLPASALPTALPSTLTPPTLSMPTVQAVSLQAPPPMPMPMPTSLPTTSTQPLTPVGLLPSGLSPLSGLPAPPPMPLMSSSSMSSSSMPGMPAMGMSLPGPPPLPRTSTIPGLPAPPPMPTVPTPSMGSMAMGMAASMPSLPTPPPLPPAWSSTPPTSSSPPSPASLMPLAALEPPRDGSSPFARGYVSPPFTPPPLPPPPALPATSTPPPGEGLSAIVLTGIGAPLNEHLAKSVPPSSTPPLPSTLFRVADDAAPAAWRGALSDTVEKGLQGGSRAADSEHDDDLNWEAVVYDPAHAAELDVPAVPKSNAKQGLDFPGLSTSTLADLYGDNGDANSDDSDSGSTATTTATPRDPPLAAMSHKDLVELLFAGDDDLVARAARELASRGLAAVPALGERFPGRLRVDPFDPGVNVRTAAALGPVVDVLGRLGNDGLDAAITHVDSRYPAHRFAAVLLFALTPDARAMDLLRNRLHDAEPRIQKLAAEALVPFLAHPRFESLLVHLRERAAATTRPYPAEARRRATELLGEFRDVGAVPLLLTLLGFTDMQETARQALRAITLQDFGSRAKAWEKWWTRAKKRSRLDWLLEGLSSEEFELRSQAHRELADLAGDDFGYRADGDKRARQRAVEVWQQWWLDEQRRAPPRAAHLG